MIYTAIDPFLTYLPELLKGREKLTALFANYNDVLGFTNGDVETGKTGLRIRVSSGKMAPTLLVDLAMLSAGIRGGDRAALFIDEGRNLLAANSFAAQSRVEQQVQEVTVEDEPILAVIYAGRSAFDQALSLALKVKEQYGDDGTVIVLTCDCRMGEKRSKLDPLLRERQLHCVIQDSRCGGSYVMGQMVQALIDAWQPTV